MTTQKIVTGVIVGTVVALIAIPKTRKLIYDSLCKLGDQLKDLKSAAEEADVIPTT